MTCWGRSYGKAEVIFRPFLGRINGELRLLITAGLKPSMGDIRCIVFGHLTRCAVNSLRLTWSREAPIESQLSGFADRLAEFGRPSTWIDPLVEVVGTMTKGVLRKLPLFPQESSRVSSTLPP